MVGGEGQRNRERELLEAALAYGRRGWHVLPIHSPDASAPSGCSCRKPNCQSPAKHPRTKNGLTDASSEEARILKWWSTFPLANVGIATGGASGLIVIDIDPRHGGDDTIVGIEDRFGKFPETVEVLTGGGGRHIYLAHPGGYIPNSSNKLGPGIDVRGDGGYVVAPPSVHVGGRDYAWEASSEPEWN